MLAGAPAAGGELQVANVCDALAESVRLGPSRQGASGPVTLRQGASSPANAVASPAIGRCPRPAPLVPPTSRIPFAVILRNGREWKKRGANCT